MTGSDRERSVVRKNGYQMLRSVEIRNFRAFKHVKIDDCRRVNILLGENGSGKTALLEAIFLALGATPEIVMRTRVWRGVESERFSGPVEDIHRALFGDLFHQFETSRAAVISLKGDGQENRVVTVRFHPQGQQKLVPPSRRHPGATPRLVTENSPVEFEWKIQGRIVFQAKATIEDNKLNLPSAPEWIIKAVFFASHRISTGSEIANRFSLLSRTFRDKGFTSRFNELYPNITDLSVEVDTGAPMLFAKVSDLPQKIPLSLASGGMNKLAAILVAMPSYSGGVILIDEIENGLYYKQMPFIWEAILEFARAYDCQIFASTHSEECLRAIARCAQRDPEEVGVIRAYIKNGEANVLCYGGDKFADAVAEDIELR